MLHCNINSQPAPVDSFLAVLTSLGAAMDHALQGVVYGEDTGFHRARGAGRAKGPIPKASKPASRPAAKTPNASMWESTVLDNLVLRKKAFIGNPRLEEIDFPGVKLHIKIMHNGKEWARGF